MRRSDTPLAQLLAEVGWRPEHFALRLNQFAGYQGRAERVHAKTPYKWISGVIPRSPWPTLVAALFSERLQRIIGPSDLGWPDEGTELVPASAGLQLPWTAAGGLQAIQVVTDAGGMQRRMFLTILGSTLTSPALEWLIAHDADDIGRTAGHTLPIEVVDHLDAMTDRLRRIDDQVGGANSLDLVSAHLTMIRELLQNRRYDEAVGRRLHASAGELMRLGGWLSFDAGMHALAQRWWLGALYEASAAGDRGLGANILGFMSCQAKDIGQLREAVTLAEAARKGYPATAPRVSAILALRAAEAYANTGEVTDCRRALDTAFEHLRDNSPSHGTPAWAYWINPAQAHAQAGYCYLRLEDWPRARAHLRAALKLQGDGRTREGALRDALLGITYARQERPDLDQAAALGTQAVEILTTQVSSARCVKHVRRLRETLRPYRRSARVRQFDHAVEDLIRIRT
ncbi:MAG: hypothetical protein H7Y15_14210 [Pseudonocardia sp.]|nr:hypothetical protein [Pseudonocardia sp.]